MAMVNKGKNEVDLMIELRLNRTTHSLALFASCEAVFLTSEP